MEGHRRVPKGFKYQILDLNGVWYPNRRVLKGFILMSRGFAGSKANTGAAGPKRYNLNWLSVPKTPPLGYLDP